MTAVRVRTDGGLSLPCHRSFIRWSLFGGREARSTPARTLPMKSLSLALLFGATLGTALAAAGPDDTVAGFWQQADSDGHVGAWFYFTEVNGLYQGRLVKMFKQPGEQKNAPMLGLTIVKDMRRDGEKYENGTILDPRDGKVYHAQMELSADGQK